LGTGTAGPLDLSSVASVALFISPEPNGTFALSDIRTFEASVPEPSTLTLLGIGSLSLLGYGWSRRKQAVA
jgi:hypothetical protein